MSPIAMLRTRMMPPEAAIFSGNARIRSWTRSLLPALFMLLISAPPALAATYFVDGSNPSSSDSGPGSSAIPYRTISAAVLARATAGNTLIVRPSIYREMVRLTASGSANNRVVLSASGPGVTVSGSDDFSGTGKWAVVSGSVYRAVTVNWIPLQVFVDGVRLAPSTLAPATLPANAFRYVAGEGLYVNLGGGNPGARAVEVGRRANAFRITGSFVTVDGFTCTRSDDRAVTVMAANVVVRNGLMTFANKHGIGFEGSSNGLIQGNVVHHNGDHGVFVTASTRCSVIANESYSNARPTVRAANGIDVDSSTACVVGRNRVHDNQDSGIQFYRGSNNGLSYNNESCRNGDHGFDHIRSTGVRHIHDVAWGNFNDGFSFEGASGGGTLYNSIAVDNGVTTNEFDLWVDAGSSTGFLSDNNLFWDSVAGARALIKFGSTLYTSVAAYTTATGRDARSRQLDPKWVNPAGLDFRVIASSHAIDAARSNLTDWPATDIDGLARINDPATPNTGEGSIVFADIGTHEFQPAPDRAPVIVVQAAASVNENAPLSLTVTASDPDGQTITTLSADVTGLPSGSNATFSPNATRTSGTLTWTPTFDDGRAAPYSVTFTAANALTGIGSTAITVSNVDRAPVVTTPAAATVNENAQLSLNVTASDPDGQTITSLSANLTGLPNGSNAAFTVNATRTTGTLIWTPTPADGRAAPYSVTFTAANALTGTSSTAITVGNLDRAPVVTVQATATVNENAPLSLTVTASDPDGQGITALTADLTGLPSGSNATFSPNANRTSGTLTWTPTFADGRAAPYGVTFTATNALEGTGSAAITVNNVDRAPVVVAAATAAATPGALLSLIVSASDPDSETITSLTPNLTGLPGVNDAVFTPNASNTAGTLTWTPTFADGRAAPYTVTITATNALTGSASTAITVANVNRAPVVSAPATVVVGENETFVVRVTASDPDGHSITSLNANLSGLPSLNDAVFTRNASNTEGTLTWTPTSADGRAAPYSVTFTATNTLTGSASTAITVIDDRAPVVTAPAAVAVPPKARVSIDVVASDPDGQAISSLIADLSGLPPVHNAVFTPNATNTAGTLTWTPRPEDAPGPYRVTFVASNLRAGAATTSIALVADRMPVVTAPPVVTAGEGVPVTVSVTAADPDGDVIASLIAGMQGLPAGHNAVFTSNASHTAGTLTWTPTVADGRATPFIVTFTASNELGATASTQITVNDLDRAPVVTAPAAVTAVPGQLLSVVVSASDPDGSPITSLTADISALPAGNLATFTPNGSNTAGTLTWKPKPTGLPQPFVVTFTAANHLSGSAITAITVPGSVGAAVPLAQGLGASETMIFKASAYPNPLRETGELLFTTTRPGAVHVQVFDLAGRLVGQPLDEPWVAAGHHRLTLRAEDAGRRLSAGVYFYRVRASEGQRVGRFLVLK